MKRIFTLVAAAFIALGLSAQTNSTRHELSGMYLDSENSDKTTWKFTNTSMTISNSSNKGASAVGYASPDSSAVSVLQWLKVSKDVLFKIAIPEGEAAVRIEFWGASNSTAGNWAYLCYLNNAAVQEITGKPIVSVEGGSTVDGISGRDIMNNDDIKKLQYPYAPDAAKADAAPIAVIEDKEGWYSELEFLFDGNNQVVTNIVVYTVKEAQLSTYNPANDASIKNTLDMPAAPIASQRVELSPLHIDAANSDKATWKFVGTGVTISNAKNKGYGSIDNYKEVATNDSTTTSFMKVSKDVLFTLNIPEDSAVVRIEFWGLSNSNQALNWAYLCYLNNAAVQEITGKPIYAVEGGETVEGITGRDIMDNELIKALPYPYSPYVKDVTTKPVAVIEDALGWFGTLDFLFDGNNQVGTNIVVYMVHQNDLENYKADKDSSIKNELDKPVVDEGGDTGISNVVVNKTFNANAPIYNMAGQIVSKSYKGLVIQNGKKYILR